MRTHTARPGAVRSGLIRPSAVGPRELIAAFDKIRHHFGVTRLSQEAALASLGVNRGSGHEVLDRQALEMIRKAKPLAPIPPTLRGHRFTLDIPVIFDLREPSA